jgi:hypothetical protein
MCRVRTALATWPQLVVISFVALILLLAATLWRLPTTGKPVDVQLRNLEYSWQNAQAKLLLETELDSGNAALWHKLAVLYVLKQDFAAARLALDKALALEPQEAWLALRKELDKH